MRKLRTRKHGWLICSVSLVALCLVLCLVAETSAQYYGYSGYGYPSSYYGGYSGYGYGYPSSYYGGYGYGGYGYGAGAYGYYGKREAGFAPNNQNQQ